MAEDIWYTSENGLKLYAKSYGPKDAPLTVLCMHGLTRNHKDFEPMIAALGDRWRFIAVDVRGRGQSEYDPEPKNYSPQTYVEDMARLLDHLGLKQVALIGTSMGGLMSMLMMRTMPERVRGVVLNDIGPAIEKAGLTRIGSYVGNTAPVLDWNDAAEAVASIQSAAFPDATQDDWVAFARRTYKRLDNGQIQLDYDPDIALSLKNIKAGPFVKFVMWRLFRKMYATPLLVVRGGISDILSAETAARMVTRHPNATDVNVPRVGHAPILDEPEAVQAIDAFLTKLEAVT